MYARIYVYPTVFSMEYIVVYVVLHVQCSIFLFLVFIFLLSIVVYKNSRARIDATRFKMISNSVYLSIF